MITKSGIRTGMKVRTKEGKYYYVIEDWLHQFPDGGASINAMLMAVDRTDEIMFYGFLDYDEQLRLHGLEDNPWNIEAVYIFAGEDLQDMNNTEKADEWVEIHDDVQLSQELLNAYFSKFE